MSALYPDLDLTTFPDAQDQRYIMTDPSTQADLADIATYNAYVDARDMAAAAEFLSAHPQLQRMFFNAEKWNRHEDMLIAMERYYQSDVQQYLVNIVVYKGEWSSTAAYLKYNVVYANVEESSEAYMAVTTVPAGTALSDTNYWVPITLRGKQGASGTGLSWRGTWGATTEYYENDCVTYNDVIWAAVQGSTGQTPSASSVYWQSAIAVDVSAATLLAKIKTVDGAGSGLDADLLDGQQGSYYASTEDMKSALATKADLSVTLTVSALATGWTGTEAPYTQEIAVPGMTAECNAVVGLAATATAEEREACRAAMISPTAQAEGSVTITADGELPEMDLPVVVVILG